MRPLPDPADDDGPFSARRRSYFERLRQATLARRDAAQVQVTILTENLGRQLDRLAGVERLLGSSLGDRDQRELERTRRRLERNVADIRRELARQERRRRTTHADRLIEWELEHGDRRRPEPGEILLARRSKRPFARRDTA